MSVFVCPSRTMHSLKPIIYPNKAAVESIKVKRWSVYVSGPMTGLPNYNEEAFAFVEDQLRREGFEVLNPHVINKDRDHSKVKECMKRDIHQLTLCDHMTLLPGWEHSKGASFEYQVATVCGIPRLALSASQLTPALPLTIGTSATAPILSTETKGARTEWSATTMPLARSLAQTVGAPFYVGFELDTPVVAAHVTATWLGHVTPTRLQDIVKDLRTLSASLQGLAFRFGEEWLTLGPPEEIKAGKGVLVRKCALENSTQEGALREFYHKYYLHEHGEDDKRKEGPRFHVTVSETIPKRVVETWSIMKIKTVYVKQTKTQYIAASFSLVDAPTPS